MVGALMAKQVWERFTRYAGCVVFWAQERAQTAGLREVQPLHFLFAFLHAEGCLAEQDIDAGGVRREKIMAFLEIALPIADQASTEITSDDMVLSKESHLSIQQAVKEAKRQRSAEINTAHLLIGFVKQGLLSKYGLEALDFNATALLARASIKRVEPTPAWEQDAR